MAVHFNLLFLSFLQQSYTRKNSVEFVLPFPNAFHPVYIVSVLFFPPEKIGACKEC